LKHHRQIILGLEQRHVEHVPDLRGLASLERR
jgi:hypothetical protein